MIDLGAVSLGVAMIFVGVLFMALTGLAARLIPRRLTISRQNTLLPVEPDLPEHQDAVMVVHAGGRISYLNSAARQLFGVWEERPAFERMARKTRPTEAFVSLCAAEGVAQFSVGGKLIEGTSFFFPNDSGTAVLVAMRPHQIAHLGEGEVEASPHTMQVLASLAQAMSTNLDLEATLYAILDSVERLIPTDFAEINIWDAEHQHLIPYRFVGVAGVDRRLETTDERYPLGEGCSGYVAARREPVLVADVDANREFRPLVDRRKYPFRSYLGMPLLMGGELIGTLDLTSLEPDAYSEDDVAVLRLLSGQAAVALHNALVYREEKRRAQELASLANLTQAVSSARNPEELFAQLAQGIPPLLDVEMAGFLLFDDVTHRLVAQPPFIGMPANFVEFYQVEIPPDSPAERLWRTQEPIVTENAAEDPDLIDLGLAASARAAGIHQTVLFPLKSGGRSLGYLQVANKRAGTAFTPDDIRVLSVIAGQAAPIIENADLLQQSVRRALRSEALRRIASLTGSEASLDEILKFSLIELSRLLKADAAAVFFLDAEKNELSAHRASIYGVPEDLHARLGRIPVDERFAPLMVTNSQRIFVSGDTQTDERILPPYRKLIETLDVRSVIDVPLIFRRRGLGELMLASRREGYFTRSDIQLASTVASQLAIAVERAALAQQTDATLRQRVEQLNAVALAGRAYHATQQLPRLLRRIYADALRLTAAACGGVYLLKPNGKEDAYQVELYAGESPDDLEHALAPEVLNSGDAVLIPDYDQPPDGVAEGLRRPAHAGVRSALIAPLAYGDEVVGVLHLHAPVAEAFDQVTLDAMRLLASQAALAVGNLRRIRAWEQRSRSLNRRLESWQGMLERLTVPPMEKPLTQLLQEAVSDVRTLLPGAAVVIGRLDEKDRLRWETGAGLSAKALKELRRQPLTWADLKAVMPAEHLLLRSYLLPLGEDAPAWLLPLLAEGQAAGMALLHPLGDAAAPLGVLLAAPLAEAVDVSRHNLELLNAHARQIAHLLAEHRMSERLEGQVAQLEAQRHELQAAAGGGGFGSERAEALFDLIEKVTHQPDKQAILDTLGEGLLAAMSFTGVVLLEAPRTHSPVLRLYGEIGDESRLEALLGQRNPLLHSIQEQQPVLVADLLADEIWRHAPLLQALEAEGFICLPIFPRASAPLSVLGVWREGGEAFAPGDERLLDLLATQTAVTLDHLDLFTNTSQQLRDMHLLTEFSRQLSGLDADGVLENLLDSVLEIVHPAQAGMVVLRAPDGALRPRLARGYVNAAALLQVDFSTGSNLVLETFENPTARRVGEVDAAVHYNLGREALLHYQEALGEMLPLSSLLVPLKSEQQMLGVLVLDNFEAPHAFPGDELMLVTSLARQAALTLENLRLYQAAEQRAAQLQALNQASAAIAAQLQASELTAVLLDALADVLPYDAAALWLWRGDDLIIDAARGFARAEELVGLTTAVEDSQLFATILATGEPVYVPDVRADERFPGSEAERLTWLAAPLSSKGEILGVLVVEKREPDYYPPEQQQIFLAFANQAAVALENADLYRQMLERTEELDRRSHRLAMINQFSESIVHSLDVEALLQTLCDELGRVFTGVGVAAVLPYEEGFQLRYETPVVEAELPAVIPAAPLFEHLAQSLGIFSSRRLAEEALLEPLMPFLATRQAAALLVLPLVAGESVQGYVLVYSSEEERFSSAEVELARIFSNQAAVALQNASLFARMRQLTVELEERVEERTRQLEREHYRAQSLLRIMRELSASLDLDHVLNRTLAVLNDITGAEQSTILLARPGEETFYYRAALGYTVPPPLGGRQTALSLGSGLAGWIFEHRHGVLLHNILEDARWLREDVDNPEHRSAIGVPLMVGEEMKGVMLLFHRQEGRFAADQLEMAQAAANQIAVAINNAELFSLIRQQSEQLGEMLRQQQVETSRSRAILEAVADGVLVTDNKRMITLFNESAERILNLKREQVMGKSLESFRGLFGAAAQSWLDTIIAWSAQPGRAGIEDTYAERITLDDQRVVAVHLAPVHMASEFLGTVSIFRDITHEVEVDRLKSEFVATVSHELRTPMTSIKGYVEILLMGAAGELSEQQLQFLRVVRENTDRLTVLVNDLLDVSRIEAGKIDLVMQSLRLQDLISDVVAEIERRAAEEAKPLTFTVEVPADLPRVRGDEARVRQIVTNLVSNAYHYTPAGGHVHVSAKPLGDEVQVDVRDDGIGIPPEDQARVFERFFRGEDPLVIATSGTGLGLSIVQQLVEMHHGRIWVESTGVPGEGSTFSFTLPQYRTEQR